VQDPRGFTAKLSDFGLSMKMAAHDGQVPGIKYGTVQYLAPEVLSTHIMTKKADVFSFGIIMWEVWHSRLFAEFYNIEKKKRKACAAHGSLQPLKFESFLPSA
jgi:serine/threonine protein kinase